jgi:hypothetical protein
MLLGMEVPSVYIVPVERFCREMGPALGINLAEFEFPAYFNYFVRSKRCTLVIDSADAETDIRSVFGETLLGPQQFRDHSVPLANMDEDFDPSFPVDSRPNFYKEFLNFRTAEATTDHPELSIDTLLHFCHFQGSRQNQETHTKDVLGAPPILPEFDPDEVVTEKHRKERMPRRRYSAHSGTVEGNDNLGAISEDGLATVGHESAAGDLLTGSVPRTQSLSSLPNFHDEPLGPVSNSPPPEGQMESDRRGSLKGRRDSANSQLTAASENSTSSHVSYPLEFGTDDDTEFQDAWMYSQVKWLGKRNQCADNDVCLMYPNKCSPQHR